jgi:hypothetical protein
VSNIITNPYFAFALKAKRGNSTSVRGEGLAGLLELAMKSECRWTMASAGSDLSDIYGLHLQWSDETESYNVYSRDYRRRWPEPAQVIMLADIRRARESGVVSTEPAPVVATANPAA